MRRRTRRCFGLLALAAMCVSLGEAVVASTCAPMSMTAGAAAVAAAPTGGEHRAGHAMDCEFAVAHDSDDQGRHCPFGPAMGPGCTGAPSVPALVLEVGLGPVQSSRPAPSEAVGPLLLLTRATFHPPRI